MATMPKWEKNVLLDVYRKNRAAKRCNIVNDLKATGQELTHMLRSEIKVLQLKIEVIMEENQLTSFSNSSYSCGEKLHQSLIDHDKVTDQNIQKIIEGNFDGDVTE